MKQRIILLVIALFFAFGGNAQQYNFKNYSVKNGVAQSQVYSVIQDVRGYIWLGTFGGGISRFDGWNFKTFSEQDGLVNNYVYDIEEDKQHNLWIATKGGLSFYDGEQFTNYNEIGPIHQVELDDADHVFLGSTEGIFRLTDGKFVNLLSSIQLDDKIIRALYVVDENNIYFGTDHGFYALQKTNGSYSLTDFGSQNELMKNSIASIARDGNGNFWVGTHGDGAYCYDGKRFFRIDYHHELYRQTVQGITVDSKGDLWFSTLNGIVHYNPAKKQFSTLAQEHGLTNNHVRTVCEDLNGNYWIGTSGGGVSHYLGKQFTTYTTNDGLAGNFIYAVFRDSKGSFWVGNSNKGVSVFANNKVTNYDAENGFADLKVKSICEGQDRIILGTERDGIYVYDGKSFKALPDFKRMLIRSVISDNNGTIWIATGGDGIFSLKWNKNSPEIKQYGSKNGLREEWTTTLHCDKWNRIWYGTETRGIGQIAKGKPSISFSEKDGLASNTIRSFCEDQSGNLWIGTAGKGVSRIALYKKNRRIYSIGSKEGLTSLNVYLLAIDRSNNLIIGSEKGLDYMYLNEQRAIKEIVHFGNEEGFAGVETCTNSVFCDRDGSIWFGTINGLNHYNGTQRVRNTRPPIVNMLDIKLFYESVQTTSGLKSRGKWNQWKPLELSYDQNHITFEFLGINQSAPNKVRYKWKLVGFDDKWSPESTDRSILYSNLNPGKYTFLLKACNEEGMWSEPISIELTISQPYWKTWWFIFLCFIIGLASAGVLFMFVLKRSKRKGEEERQKLEMHNQIMELERKALRLQMNPHFIFNAFNSIQSLVGTDKEDEARYYLAKFSRLMRSILDNSQKAVITLQEELETLENYLMIEKFCHGDRFDYTLTVAEGTETSFIELPPMLIQPFVENAIKHGFKFGEDESEKRGQLSLHISEEKNVMTCIIRDNGIGRSRSAALKAESIETYHVSRGMSVTQERLGVLKGEKSTGNLIINDLTHADGSAAGTEIILTISID